MTVTWLAVPTGARVRSPQLLSHIRIQSAAGPLGAPPAIPPPRKACGFPGSLLLPSILTTACLICHLNLNIKF